MATFSDFTSTVASTAPQKNTTTTENTSTISKDTANNNKANNNRFYSKIAECIVSLSLPNGKSSLNGPTNTTTNNNVSSSFSNTLETPNNSSSNNSNTDLCSLLYLWNKNRRHPMILLQKISLKEAKKFIHKKIPVENREIIEITNDNDSSSFPPKNSLSSPPLPPPLPTTNSETFTNTDTNNHQQRNDSPLKEEKSATETTVPISSVLRSESLRINPEELAYMKYSNESEELYVTHGTTFVSLVLKGPPPSVVQKKKTTWQWKKLARRIVLDFARYLEELQAGEESGSDDDDDPPVRQPLVILAGKVKLPEDHDFHACVTDIMKFNVPPVIPIKHNYAEIPPKGTFLPNAPTAISGSIENIRLLQNGEGGGVSSFARTGNSNMNTNYRHHNNSNSNDTNYVPNPNYAMRGSGRSFNNSNNNSNNYNNNNSNDYYPPNNSSAYNPNTEYSYSSPHPPPSRAAYDSATYPSSLVNAPVYHPSSNVQSTVNQEYEQQQNNTTRNLSPMYIPYSTPTYLIPSYNPVDGTTNYVAATSSPSMYSLPSMPVVQPTTTAYLVKPNVPWTPTNTTLVPTTGSTPYGAVNPQTVMYSAVQASASSSSASPNDTNGGPIMVMATNPPPYPAPSSVSSSTNPSLPIPYMNTPNTYYYVNQ